MQAEKSLKCPNCLSSVSDDLGFCPNCTVDLYNCSSCNALILETDTICKNCNSKLDEEKVNLSVNETLNLRSVYEYKSLEVPTKLLLILFALLIFFSIVNINVVASDISFISDNMNSMDSTDNIYDDELSIFELLVSVSYLLSVVVVFAAWIIYFIWVRRAYRNLQTLQLKALEFSSGWAIGSYFVPILNLVRPYTMMKEIWFGSQPKNNFKDESDFELHERRTTSRFLPLWWAAFLINGLISEISFWFNLKADTPQKLVTSYRFDIAHSVTEIIFSVVVIYLIWVINNWQSEKAKIKPSRYCQHCGNNVEADALLCPNCGKQLIYNN